MSWGATPGGVKVEGEVEWVRKPTPPGKRLTGQVALITGSGRGFGRETARVFAEEGADVIINDLGDPESKRMGEETVKAIKAIGRKSAFIPCDIMKWDEVKAMAEKVWKEFGHCDILVNNAGSTAGDVMSFRELNQRSIDHTLDLDIKGTLYCTHEFGIRMLDRQKSGAIVNVCSNVVSTGSPRAPHYAAAKYGVLGLTKSYALALAPYVRVNAIGPGYMETEALMKRKDWTPERKKYLLSVTPSKSMGRVPNIAHIVAFLASQDSFHMTGNLVICDGGFSMPGA